MHKSNSFVTTCIYWTKPTMSHIDEPSVAKWRYATDMSCWHCNVTTTSVAKWRYATDMSSWHCNVTTTHSVLMTQHEWIMQLLPLRCMYISMASTSRLVDLYDVIDAVSISGNAWVYNSSSSNEQYNRGIRFDLKLHDLKWNRKTN